MSQDQITSPKIMVDASPGPAQAKAAVRQIFLSLGSVAAALGAAGMAHQFKALADVSGPIVALLGSLVTVGAFYYGQVHTKKDATTKASLVTLVDDHRVASFK